jgi:hypothetical protein
MMASRAFAQSLVQIFWDVFKGNRSHKDFPTKTIMEP